MNLLDKLFDTLINEDDLPIKTITHKSYLFTQLAKELSELIDKLEVDADERADLINLIDRLVDEAEAEAEKQSCKRSYRRLLSEILYNIDDLRQYCDL